MAEIRLVQCRTRAEMRAFLSLSEDKGLFSRRRAFAPDKSACDPRRNPLLRARRHAFLLALEDDRPAARLLLVDGGEEAWFSMLRVSNAEAAHALFGAADDVARGWGANELRGPVSPDGCGFGLGVALSDSLGDGLPWHPGMDLQAVGTLLECGFSLCTELAELEISIAGRENPYKNARAFAMRHGGIEVKRLGLNSAFACRSAYVCSEDAHDRGYEAFARVFARCGKLSPKGRALIAFAADEPAGWLLCALEKKRLRLLHVQIRRAFRRGPCAAALLETAWDMAVEHGLDRVRASTIDVQNGASLRMARSAGGTVVNAYGVFLREIQPESAQ